MTILRKVLRAFPLDISLFRVFQFNNSDFEIWQHLATGSVAVLVREVPVMTEARTSWTAATWIYVLAGHVVYQCVGKAWGCNELCWYKCAGVDKVLKIWGTFQKQGLWEEGGPWGRRGNQSANTILFLFLFAAQEWRPCLTTPRCTTTMPIFWKTRAVTLRRSTTTKLLSSKSLEGWVGFWLCSAVQPAGSPALPHWE